MLQINIVAESLEQFNKSIDTLDIGNYGSVEYNVKPLQYWINTNQKAIYYIEFRRGTDDWLTKFIKENILHSLSTDVIEFIK